MTLVFLDDNGIVVKGKKTEPHAAHKTVLDRLDTEHLVIS